MRRTICRFGGATALAVGLLVAGAPVTNAQMRHGAGSGQDRNGQSQPGVQQSSLQSSAGANFLAVMRRNLEVETNLSKMALKKSQNEQIKKFAKQVVSENHKNEMALLTAYSSNLQVGTPALAAPVPSETRDAEKQMKKLTGQQFDAMYLVQMNDYVKNDRQNLTDASSLTDIDSLVKRMQNSAEEREQQIGQMAQSENPNAGEAAPPQQ